MSWRCLQLGVLSTRIPPPLTNRSFCTWGGSCFLGPSIRDPIILGPYSALLIFPYNYCCGSMHVVCYGHSDNMMISAIPFYRALEPECSIRLCMGSVGALRTSIFQLSSPLQTAPKLQKRSGDADVYTSHVSVYMHECMHVDVQLDVSHGLHFWQHPCTQS